MVAGKSAIMAANAIAVLLAWPCGFLLYAVKTISVAVVKERRAVLLCSATRTEGMLCW